MYQEKLVDTEGAIRNEDYFWPYDNKTFVHDLHTPKLSNQNEVFILCSVQIAAVIFFKYLSDYNCFPLIKIFLKL